MNRMHFSQTIFSAFIRTILLTLLFVPMIAFAEGSTCDATSFCNPLLAPDLRTFLDIVLNALILILFPFVILFFIYAGFQLVVAQGNPGEIAKARKAILWTTIGALIILGAKAISLAIQSTVTEIQGSVEAPHPHLSQLDHDVV